MGPSTGGVTTAAPLAAGATPDDQRPRIAVTVVAGARSFDVVVDEFLTVGAVLELVLGTHDVPAVVAAGRVVRSERTLAGAGVATGAVLVAGAGGGDAAYLMPGRALDGPLPTGSGRTPSGMPPARPHVGARLPVAPGASSSRDDLASPGRAAGPMAVAVPMGDAAPIGPEGTLAGSGSTGTPVSSAAGRVCGAAFAALMSGLAGYAAAIAPIEASGASGPVPRVVLLAALLLGGFALGQPRGVDPLVRHTAPVLGVAAGAAAGWLGSGSGLVAAVAGCGAGALVALSGRADLGLDRQVPQVWAAGAVLVGVLSLAGLVVGSTVSAVAALVLAVLALLPRVLPAWVIDVDDVVLVDIARLSVTSWSPRERRRRPHSRWRIDAQGVRVLVHTAMLTQTAALTGVLALVWGSALLLTGQAQASAAQWSWATVLVLATASASLALGARAFRRRVDRVLLRFAAAGPAAAALVPALLALPPTAGSAVSAGAAALGIGLAVLARAVGRGYASLGLARAADALDGLATVAVLPLAVWASGALAWSQGVLG
jgi:hypothetical protein